MSVRIVLDQQHGHFTNLDFVSGRVALQLLSNTTISAINVKLEGVSRTRLAGPRFPNDTRSDKVKTELELHKVLYKVQTVFPQPGLSSSAGPNNAQFTLATGLYEYPFRFKFPFNNNCKNQTSVLQDVGFGDLRVQLGTDTTKHVKKTLPPSLGGFPGEAEIKYFVKVTVVRPKFYQENLRYEHPIKFVPIEPIRAAKRLEETYARRQHQFNAYHNQPKRSLFKKSTATPADEPPLSVRVDARLPSPAILTCHQPVPLRILIERLNASTAGIFLGMFQIELISFTQVRAHDLHRTETGSWIIVSLANMAMSLGNASSPGGKEYKVPSSLWDHLPLPNTVAPSFETCNISRKYEIEIRVGITHGTSPELIVSSLRLPVQVYSGIAPPDELLSRMQQPRPNVGTTLSPTAPVIGPVSPLTPISPAAPDLPSAQVGAYIAPPQEDDPTDLPPSYEDAMADDLAPVNGIRRDYEQPPVGSQGFADDSTINQGRGLNRNTSERLFHQNAPQPPRESSAQIASATDRKQKDDTALPVGDQRVVDGLPQATQNISLHSAGNSSRPSLPSRKPVAKDNEAKSSNRKMTQ